MEHTVNSYAGQLSELSSTIKEMLRLVSGMLEIVQRALIHPSAELANQASVTDRKINALDHIIKDLAVTILALRNPLAQDLRLVISCLRIAVIIERMGDLCKNISKRVTVIEDMNLSPDIINKVTEMSLNLGFMMSGIINAFEYNDVEITKQVFERDDIIDKTYREIMIELTSYISTHADQTSSCLQYIFAIKNYERIGDYIVKISSMIHYMITGKKTFFT